MPPPFHASRLIARVKRKILEFHISNNRIERFHGTYRERTKVMRAFDTMKGAQGISDGERVYQNFLRPHSSLKGRTPAEAAGINLGLKDNR